MAKKWLIDAHNLMHKIPFLKGKLSYRSTDAIVEFCELIQSACVDSQIKAKIIFDGVPHLLPRKYNRIEVSYSRERTADEVIQQLLKKENAGNKWVVITDDREIRHQAYYYHADIIRCNDFIDKYINRKEKSSPKRKTVIKTVDPGSSDNPKLSDKETQELLELFLKNKK